MMFKSTLRRTALAALAALAPHATLALGNDVILPPEAVGLEPQVERTLSFRDAHGDFVLDLSSIELRQEGDRIVGTLNAALPSFLDEVNRLGNPTDFRIKGPLFFRHVRVDNLRTHAHDATVLMLRANVALRVIEHVLGVRVSNRFSKNLTVPVDLHVSEGGTVISAFTHMKSKRGFPPALEDPMRQMVEAVSRSWRLAPELVEFGVRVDRIAFFGSAQEDDLAVSVSVSLPLERLPELLLGNIPDPQSALIPTANPSRPPLPKDTATPAARTTVPRNGYAAPGGGYYAPLDRFGGGPQVFHHEP